MPDNAPRASRGPRSDAQRNRARLITAAAPLTRSGGDKVYLEQVARDAEVSTATLYRHFPTREALLLAVSQQDALDHRALAAHLLATTTPDTDLHTVTELGTLHPTPTRAQALTDR